MDSVWGNKEFLLAFLYILLYIFYIYYFLSSSFPSLLIHILSRSCAGHSYQRIRWIGYVENFFILQTLCVRMYLCKYRGSYRGARRMGGFFLFFPLQSCLLFFCHWAGAFSFFIQTGLRRLAYYKACLFSHHIFYFRISPAKTASIGYLASSLLFFFLR
ncbi:hypothetical protein B9Z19DRAFT_43362 [Tuber borchii]|uniref:Uncharacterized protein n=1 Tax=Tuber borchii TaxID=42251 RepID=A0A2T6ZTH6_TUBBO|nr:hypothetical protein B9Z19DRAFT_43362 [Tuber borchii]